MQYPNASLELCWPAENGKMNLRQIGRTANDMTALLHLAVLPNFSTASRSLRVVPYPARGAVDFPRDPVEAAMSVMERFALSDSAVWRAES